MSRYGWEDVLANTPEGIIAGERAGGRALVMDDKLPLRGIHAPETRAALEALGFEFGEETGEGLRIQAHQCTSNASCRTDGRKEQIRTTTTGAALTYSIRKAANALRCSRKKRLMTATPQSV